jgi:hypothetical protein
MSAPPFGGALIPTHSDRGARNVSAAVTATVTTGTAVTVSAPVAATTPRLARTSLVHRQAPATDVTSIEFLDGATGVFIAHLHKSESAGAAGVAVGHHFG